MKSEKEIKKKFDIMWEALHNNDGYYLYGWVLALDWVMDGKLIKVKRDKVIK